MSSPTDVDRQLADWFAEEAPGRAPEHLRAAIDRRLEQTPQRVVRAAVRSAFPTARPWMVAAAAVILLVAALGASAWIPRSQSVGSSSPSGPATAQPSSAPSPSAATRVTDLARVADLSPSGGGILGDIAVSGSRLIVVGTTTSNGSQAASAWTSSDGVTWSSVPGSAGTGGMLMSRLIADGPAPAAFGLECPGAPQPCAFARVTLASAGAQWEALRWIAGSPAYGTPNVGGPGYGFMLNAVAAGDQAEVMVGSAVNFEGPTPIGPAVATSTDGHTWTWHVLAGAQPSGASMSGVAAGSHGFVAVGTGPSVHPAAWVSADGSRWDPVPDATAPTGGELDDVAAGGGGYVAVGRSGESAAAWVSSDGLTWRPAPSGASMDDGWMTRVIWTGTTFLAVGKTGAGDGAAWISTDGSSWTRLDTSGAFKGIPIVGGAALGSRLTLVGQDAGGHLVVAQGGF